jgi:hypothetical protein
MLKSDFHKTRGKGKKNSFTGTAQEIFLAQ